MTHGDAPAPGTASNERLFTAAFIALGVAELAYFTGAGVLIPVVPLFAAESLGGGEVGAGIAVGAFSVSALLLRPLAGRLSDRRGRRPLLIGGALLYALATLAHIAVPHLAVLVALRLVLGAAEAFFFVAGFAALADLAPPGRTGEALSFNSLSLYLGVAFGPVLGQFLLASGGFPLAFGGAAALALAACLLSTRVPETSTPDPHAPATPLISRVAVGPALALFTGIAGMAGFLTFVALRARELGSNDWGIVLFLFGLTVVGCRILFAKLPDRVPPLRVGALALVLMAAGLSVAAVMPSLSGLVVGAAILGVGVAFATPAFFASIFSRVPPGERGAASGTTSVFLDLAFGGGPMVLGFVAGAAGIPAAFLAGAGLAAIGAAGTVILGSRAPTAAAHAGA